MDSDVLIQIFLPGHKLFDDSDCAFGKLSLILPETLIHLNIIHMDWPFGFCVKTVYTWFEVRCIIVKES